MVGDATTVTRALRSPITARLQAVHRPNQGCLLALLLVAFVSVVGALFGVLLHGGGGDASPEPSSGVAN